MSTEHEEDDRFPIDDRTIDRLVDGALPAAERRALFVRLKNEPDGWRRCALAFLEAQAWGEALGPLAESGWTEEMTDDRCPMPDPTEGMTDDRCPMADPRIATAVSAINHPSSAISHQPSAIGHPSSAINQQPSTISHQPSAIGHQPSAIRRFACAAWLLAAAAGMLVAFGLGWALRGDQSAGQVAQVVPKAVEAASNPPALATNAAPGPRPEARNTPALPLPPPVVKRLERQGYQVEQRQRLVSMETKDGRRLSVPVDEVRVRFVGDRTY